MTLASLAAKKPAAPHKTCLTCWTLKQLEAKDPAYAAALEAALANSHVRYSEISQVLLDERGIRLSANNVSRHARGRCERGEKYR